MGSHFVIARRNATFLTHWYNSYRDNYKPDRTWNSLEVPFDIATRFPRIIHVEGYNFTRPNKSNLDQIFKQNYDWSTNYGIHLYIKAFKQRLNATVIRTLNTTIGSVCRHVLFGNKELCSS